MQRDSFTLWGGIAYKEKGGAPLEFKASSKQNKTAKPVQLDSQRSLKVLQYLQFA